MPHKSPIKVVHIASGDLWAGAEVQLFTLAKTLHQLENVTVRVILLNHGELENRLLKQGIPVDVLDETSLNGIQIFFRLIKLLRQHRPDVVHTHRIKENILGGLSAKLAGNIPSLRTAHGAPEHQPGWRKPHKQILYYLDWLVGRFLQRKIVAVSDDLATILKKAFPAEKITVIENGIDIEALTPYIKRQESHKIPSSPFRIGLVGRLVPVKRVDIFIETAKYLQEQFPTINAQFYIYGDGPLRSELEQLSASLNLQDTIHFEGHVSEIHAAIAALDILLITSDHEGLPMTLLEALALRIPVISHSIGGISKVLEKSKCNRLLQSQKASTFAEAISDILSVDRTSIREGIDQDKEIVNTYYSAHANTQKYSRLYQILVTNYSD